jgi:hypothetical protein
MAKKLLMGSELFFSPLDGKPALRPIRRKAGFNQSEPRVSSTTNRMIKTTPMTPEGP